MLDETPRTFTFEEGVVSKTLTVTNDRVKSLLIQKVDEKTKQPLKGATFDVLNAAGERIASVTTNASGKATVTDLKLGKYTVVETKAPLGYLLDETPRPIRFETAAGDVMTLVVENTMDPEYEFEEPGIPSGPGNGDSEKPTPTPDPDVTFEEDGVPTGAGKPSVIDRLPFLGESASNGSWIGLLLLLIGAGVLWSTRKRKTA